MNENLILNITFGLYMFIMIATCVFVPLLDFPFALNDAIGKSKTGYEQIEKADKSIQKISTSIGNIKNDFKEQVLDIL